MKNLYIAISFVTVFIVASCNKDKTNYDLQAGEVVTITGIEPTYTVISEKDSLIIDPVVNSNQADADFEYLWGLYETGLTGGIPVLDTIAQTKRLEYPVKKPAKGWTLVFRATNKKTQYSEFFTSNINIVTEFTRGWYVAKDDGTQSDLDLFLTPNSIFPEGDKKEDIYSLVNGGKLEGKAGIMAYLTSYRSTASGSATPTNTKTLMLVTDKNASAIFINTLKDIRDFSTLFYQTPAVNAPDAAFSGPGAYYFVNDGQVHNISTSTLNSGIFGARVLKDELNTPYRLSKYFIGSVYDDPYFFDQTSSSFMTIIGAGTMMTAVADDPATQMPSAGNNKTLLYMGYKSAVYLPAPEYRYKVTGYAVLQDKTDPSVKILSEVATDDGKIRLTNDTLTPSDKIYNATSYTLLSEDENIIYFTVGNEVWSRNLSSKAEQLQFAAPGDEQITFIRHKKYTSETAYAYNYFMIGTTSGGNYKVRMFTKSSGSLAPAPEFTLEGKGMVRDVIYISPSVSQYTYPTSF